jgi:putative aldouronate transport system permease protein
MANYLGAKVAVKKGGRLNTGDTLCDVCNTIFWIIIMIIVIYPLWLVIIDSFSDPEAVWSGRVVLFPVGFSVAGYQEILQSEKLLRAYANSVIYTVSGTALSVMITMMGAYALSRQFAGKKVFNFLLVFTMFFSGGLIPSFLINRAIGLYNNPLVMIVTGTVSVWYLMVARTYLQSTIPNEMYDAARIDGASHFTYFFRVVLPLSGTIMAVLCVYNGVARWNDYFTALVYIQKESLLPLQTVLRRVLATAQANASSLINADKIEGLDVSAITKKSEVLKYCTIVVSTAPAVLLYMLMQKYFVKGVMIGSLKG